jgi:hypothetical protein
VEIVHRPESAPPSKLMRSVRRPLGLASNRVLLAGFMAPAAWLLAGCSSGAGDIISSVALPSQQSAQAAEADGLDMSASADRLASKPSLTPGQRTYLDGLLAAGVHPSNDLRALSIGAYVCQARAAGQSDQAVRDAVAPMVRGDITGAAASSPQTPAVANIDTVVGDFIHIATQKLC